MEVLDSLPAAVSAECNDQLIAALLQQLWGIKSLNSVKDGKLYYQFYKSRVQAIDYSQFSPRSHRDILRLVDFLKSNRHEPFSTVINKILASDPQWIGFKSQSRQGARSVIDFGISIWLMVMPRQWSEIESLSEHIKSLFPPSTLQTRLSGPDSISYTARTLHRIAGLDIVWTSRLQDHLRMDVQSAQLFVFRHATFVTNRNGLEESEIYPQGLLRETAETMALLFPLTDAPRRRWDRRIREKADIDVEDGLAYSVSRDTAHFIHWGSRLIAIQNAFDTSKPRKVRQWVYDRRDGNQQATFWLAVAAIVLTLLFGLIQSVASVIQVVKH